MWLNIVEGFFIGFTASLIIKDGPISWKWWAIVLPANVMSMVLNVLILGHS
jgi:hypothetical protein